MIIKLDDYYMYKIFVGKLIYHPAFISISEEYTQHNIIFKPLMQLM